MKQSCEGKWIKGLLTPIEGILVIVARLVRNLDACPPFIRILEQIDV